LALPESTEPNNNFASSSETAKTKTKPLANPQLPGTKAAYNPGVASQSWREVTGRPDAKAKAGTTSVDSQPADLAVRTKPVETVAEDEGNGDPTGEGQSAQTDS